MRKNKLYALMALIIAISLLTACGAPKAAAPAAESAPAAQEAAPETNAPAEEASPVEEEPAPLTADLITYEGVLDGTDILDGDTVALHATSDLEVFPAEICYDMFGVTEELQQKAEITDDVHMIGLIIDNKTDKVLYPAACPGSLVVNGQPVADERFALLTINTIFAGINVISEESVDPGSSSQMVFFLLAGEDLLPELTGLDHIETVAFSFDLLDETGNTVDTADIEITAFRPLTEDELANEEAPTPVLNSDSIEGVVEIEITDMEIENEGDDFSSVAGITIHNLRDRACEITLYDIYVNGVKSSSEIGEIGMGYYVEAGDTIFSTVAVANDLLDQLGISTADEIESIVAELVIHFVNSDGTIDEEGAVFIEEYVIR